MAELVCSGELYKLGGGALSRLQRRFFELRDNGALTYFDKPNGEEKGAVYIEGAKVIDRGTFHGKQCFSIEGVHLAKGVKEYFLYADDASQKWMWYQNIQRLSRRYDFLTEEDVDEDGDDDGEGGPIAPVGDDEAPQPKRSKSSTLARIERSVVYKACIHDTLENQRCADCGRRDPTWSVSNPYGVFVCIECIGVHRHLWASWCKEVELDRWSDDEVAYMLQRGNKTVNEELEYHCPAPFVKPNMWSSRTVREQFITAKYREKVFSRAHVGVLDGQPQPPTRDSASRKDHQARLRKANVLGSPPNYIGVAMLTIDEALGFSCNGAVAVVTNGFQEVRTRPATKSGDGSKACCFRETLQIGVDHLQRPLYITVYESDTKIAATAELVAGHALSQPPLGDASSTPDSVVFSVPLVGPLVPAASGAYLVGRLSFLKLT